MTVTIGAGKYKVGQDYKEWINFFKKNLIKKKTKKKKVLLKKKNLNFYKIKKKFYGHNVRREQSQSH